MGKIAKLALTVVLAALFIKAVSFYSYATGIADQFRYKLTVSFEDQGKEVSASGVVEVTLRRDLCASFCSLHTSIRGEAIPVRFSTGKQLFVLLGIADHSLEAAKMLMPYDVLHPKPPYTKISELPDTKVPVPPQFLPTMISFTDMADEQTAFIVRPNELNVLGSDLQYLSTTIAVTQDPVTEAIENLLPWVKSPERGGPNRTKSGSGLITYYPAGNRNSQQLQADLRPFLKKE